MFEEQYRRDNEKLHAREASFMEIERKWKEEKQREKRRGRIVRYGAIAAAVLLVVGTTAGVLLKNAGLIGHDEATAPAEAMMLAANSAAQEEASKEIRSYDELYDLIESMGGARTAAKGAAIPGSGAAVTTESAASDMSMEMGGVPEPTAMDAPTGGGSYSETNTQVAGVDEADIVKTDGEYIYYIAENRLVILKADGKDASLVSRTEFSGEDGWWAYANEMYVLGDRLMIISRGTSMIWVASESGSHESYQDRTVSAVYDISDRAKPKQVVTLGQSGSYVSSRRIGDYVYVVTSQFIYDAVRAEPITYVPQLLTDGKSESVAISDIYIYDRPQDMAYTVVSSFDLASGTRQQTAKAAFGGAGEIYANAAHLLVAVNENDSETKPIAPGEDGRNVQVTRSKNATKLMLFSLLDGRIERLATGRVDGTLVNQFAMDEYENAFRIVTTVNEWEERIYTDGVDTYEYDDRTHNCLFTLDQNLEKIGELTGLAEDEWVESVRFDGEIVYFVTFRQTDPLFSVDVSNPAKPRLLGALKIPGFSEYMHLFSENRLFGLGYHADEETGWREGVKLTMFDVSDPKDVKEKTTLRLDEDYTMVGQNHKAILIDAARNLIAFPADGQYYIFGYSDEKGFFEKAVVSIGSDWDASARGLFVDACFYVLTGSRMCVFSLDGFDRLTELHF